MQIDWLTVLAQAINFLVLVYLLRRFLYRPVQQAMARREANIQQQLQQALEREQQAQQAAQRLREQNDALAQHKEQLMQQAAQEVQARRQALLEEARQEVQATRDAWQQQIERERPEFMRQFRSQAAQATVQVARRLLRDLADADLEQQLIKTFVKQLEEIDHDLLQALRKSAHKAQRIEVITSFEADADTRARLKRAVQHHLLEGKEREIEFRHAEPLICGIEVDVDGRRVGWTMAQSLRTLEDELGRALSPNQEKA